LERKEVAKYCPAIEAAFRLVIEMLGLLVVFLVFREIGEWVTEDKFSPDILLSLVVLPAIYLLKDLPEILEPLFVKVNFSKEEIEVESGILTRSKDCLTLKNIENIEVVTTPLGRYFNYGTLNLYAYGSWVQLPNILDYKNLQDSIKESINTET